MASQSAAATGRTTVRLLLSRFTLLYHLNVSVSQKLYVHALIFISIEKKNPEVYIVFWVSDKKLTVAESVRTSTVAW